MVTNLCPNAYDGNYCAAPGELNKQGYAYHFDIMSRDGLVNGKRWDNPVVAFKEIACTPSMADRWSECQDCAAPGKLGAYPPKA